MLEVDRRAVTIIAYILYGMRRLASQISDMPDVFYYLLRPAEARQAVYDWPYASWLQEEEARL